MPYHILVVDDDPFQCKTIKLALEKSLNYQVSTLNSGEAAIDLLLSSGGNNIDLVILDLSMPNTDGIEVLKSVMPHKPELPIIINTAYGDVKKAVEAIKCGAVNFIEKQDGFEKIKVCIENVRMRSSLNLEVKKLQKYSQNVFKFNDIIGESAAIKRAVKLAKKASLSNIPVHVFGESGVGKELFARSIHAESMRSTKPFVSINCSAIPKDLVESTLFGHEKGAFTGAVNSVLGKFREAHGGTLFLDEVGELPTDIQPKLLRALQNMEIEPVGSGKVIDVNVRIISATNKNLEELIKQGKFREDLYYRLNVFQLDVPPLRDRKDDIALLTEYLVAKICLRENIIPKEVSKDLHQILSEYKWLGNVRQLENAIFKAIVLSESDILTLKDFGNILTFLQNKNGKQIPTSDFENISYVNNNKPQFKTLTEHEAEVIRNTLEYYSWNISKVSKILGIGRSTLYRKMKEYDIDVNGSVEELEVVQGNNRKTS